MAGKGDRDRGIGYWERQRAQGKWCESGSAEACDGFGGRNGCECMRVHLCARLKSDADRAVFGNVRSFLGGMLSHALA